MEGRARLATLNLAPGVQVYGERLVRLEGLEWRVWDPYRSKLAAALEKGLRELPVREGLQVLYLGVSTGTTASHVSDLIGERGLLFGVEVAPRVAREFLDRVAAHRANVIPMVADARRPELYPSMLGKADLVYCDIAQPDQTEIAIANCRLHLKPGGDLLLAVKARSIDVTRRPREIFREEVERLRAADFQVVQVIRLEPFDRDHVLIHARAPGKG